MITFYNQNLNSSSLFNLPKYTKINKNDISALEQKIGGTKMSIKTYFQKLLDMQNVKLTLLIKFVCMNSQYRVYLNPYASPNPEPQRSPQPPQPQQPQYYQSRYPSINTSNNAQTYENRVRQTYQPANTNSTAVAKQVSNLASGWGSVNTANTANTVNTTNTNFGNNENVGGEQKQKFKEVTEDLAKLKKKLENIVISQGNSDTRVNRSLDKYYSPYYREGDVKVQRVYARVVTRPTDKLNQSVTVPPSQPSFTTATTTKPKPEIQPKQQQRTQILNSPNINQQKNKQKVEIRRQVPKIQTRVQQKIGSSSSLLNLIEERQQRRIQSIVADSAPTPQLKRIQTQPSQGITYTRTLNSYNRNSGYPFQQPQSNQSNQSNQSQQSYQSQAQSRNGTDYRFQSSYAATQNGQINSSTLSNQNSISYFQHQRIVNQLIKEKRELRQNLEKMERQRNILIEEKERVKQYLEKEQVKSKDIQVKYNQISYQHEQSKIREKSHKQKIHTLEKELSNSRNKGRNSFEDVLREQLEQSRKIKELVQQKNDQISKLNDAVVQNRRKTQQAINQANIQKIKFMSEKKQMQQLQQIIILNKDNQIKTLRHALQTMQSKLQTTIKDNKSKDQFMQQHLVGRIKQGEQKQYVFRFLEHYQISFPVNNVKQKLLQEQKQIQRLNRIICEMEQHRR